MDRTKLLKPLLLLMFFLIAFHYVGLKFYWDYTTWWWDMIMHFLAGFWEGLLFLWFFSIKDIPFLKPSLDFRDPKLFHKAIFYVLLIGLWWEIFEFYINNYLSMYSFDMIDTSSDVILVLAGGFLAISYFSKRIMSSGQNNVQLK